EEGSLLVTNERHKNCLVLAGEALSKAVENLDKGEPLELVAEDIRSALIALEEIVGKTYSEDLLGRIFSTFCIGK
ncbi:MAG: tRNA uridine-5-carboxymethylaminomethyl(34) synthesis GTPase MnmE, partial [Candidatus Dadabacteria bacterium]